MIEFGEKIKQLREERGMTQQTMAEQLYVTRQAVSRWECGARYPDLLTAKKIGQILNVTVDELLSGEELKVNVEKEPVLAQPVENIVQTVLYTIAAIAYLLMCIFSLYSLVQPNEGLANTPAGKISFLQISTMCGYVINLMAVSFGLILSIRNKLTAKVTGYLMCLPYGLAALSFVLTYMDMCIKKNGSLSITSWISDFVVPLVFALCILFFFCRKEKRLPLAILLVICLVSLGYIALSLRSFLPRTTELGFVVRTVHCFGKLGMILLLGYQAYVWDRKRKDAISPVPCHTPQSGLVQEKGTGHLL